MRVMSVNLIAMAQLHEASGLGREYSVGTCWLTKIGSILVVFSPDNVLGANKGMEQLG